MSAYVTKSPWVVHYDGSSCNGCDIEVLACLTPMYDVERFGIINCGNPKHADVFLVTGSVNEQNKGVVKQIYDQMPEPKVVVAVGICACSGGIFKDCYNILGGVDQVIPVDAYVPGCAARPEAIIDAVVKGLGIMQAKKEAMNRGELPLASAKYQNKEEAVAAPADEAEETVAEEPAAEAAADETVTEAVADETVTEAAAEEAPAEETAPSAPSGDDPILCSDECILCGACAGECPASAITVDDSWSVDGDTCVRCGACIDACPVSCLSMNE